MSGNRFQVVGKRHRGASLAPLPVRAEEKGRLSSLRWGPWGLKADQTESISLWATLRTVFSLTCTSCRLSGIHQ